MNLITILAAAAINIWSGTVNEKAHVTLTPYIPDDAGASVPAVIVCPGGSYFWLDVHNEGEMVCKWLQDNGIAAFLLKYRTAGWPDYAFGDSMMTERRQYPNPIEDLQRSIQLLRESPDFSIVDGHRIGVMGFSAGGHLAVLSTELSGTDFLLPLGIESHAALGPDFVASIYPVVTFSDGRYVHLRSLRGLLDEKRMNDEVLRDSLSLEKHARPGMAPVFLLNCRDDNVVDYENSVLLDSAMTVAGAVHDYVQMEKGGHGFGANSAKFSEETAKWQELFLTWFNKTVIK